MSRLLNLIKQAHGVKRGYRLPFIVNGTQVGDIRQEVAAEFSKYPEVFVTKSNGQLKMIELNLALRDYNERTEQVDRILRRLREKNVFEALNIWRDEFHEVRVGQHAIFKMERSAIGLFGVRSHSICVHGYVRHPKHGICAWLQKRSNAKELYPGTWDLMVGGALPPGFSVKDAAAKEAAEEASIPNDLLQNIKSAGCVYLLIKRLEDEFPMTVYVHDLELPAEFEPCNGDGEVQKFELVPAAEYAEMLYTPEWTSASCPVSVDFLIRHGVITPANEPNFNEVVQLLHSPSQMIHNNHNHS